MSRRLPFQRASLQTQFTPFAPAASHVWRMRSNVGGAVPDQIGNDEPVVLTGAGATVSGGLNLDKDQAYLCETGIGLLPQANDSTMFVDFSYSALAAAYSTIYSKSRPGVDYTLVIETASGNLQFYPSGHNLASVSPGTRYRVTIVRVASGNAYWGSVNGSPLSLFLTGSTGPSNLDTLKFGSDPAFGDRRFDGTIFQGAAWDNLALSAAQTDSLNAWVAAGKFIA